MTYRQGRGGDMRIKSYYEKDPKAAAIERQRVELQPWLEEDDQYWVE
jgi:hypothetical protein